MQSQDVARAIIASTLFLAVAVAANAQSCDLIQLPLDVRLCLEGTKLTDLKLPGADHSYSGNNKQLTLVWVRQGLDGDYLIGDDELAALADATGLFGRGATYVPEPQGVGGIVVAKGYFDLAPALPDIGALCTNMSPDLTVVDPTVVTVCSIYTDRADRSGTIDHQSTELVAVEFQ